MIKDDTTAAGIAEVSVDRATAQIQPCCQPWYS
jgi:hypothetical protein